MKRTTVLSLILTLCLAAATAVSGCRVSVSNTESAAEAVSQAVSAVEEPSEAAQTAPQTTEQETAAAAAEPEQNAVYTMDDVYKLNNTQHFAKNTLEHIFDGTINGKGKATGYHYAGIADSKGEIISGTESKTDANGIYTAKVRVSGVKKEGFSSFYPDNWTPQQVVDAINEAYDDALSDSDNPRGSLWIGHSGDLEIDMYLDNNRRITTAFPIKQ